MKVVNIIFAVCDDVRSFVGAENINSSEKKWKVLTLKENKKLKKP